MGWFSWMPWYDSDRNFVIAGFIGFLLGVPVGIYLNLFLGLVFWTWFGGQTVVQLGSTFLVKKHLDRRKLYIKDIPEDK